MASLALIAYTAIMSLLLCFLKVNLSLPGIAGGDVIKALGLPGKMVPETSGRLIADTIIRLLKEEEE
jgi:hypothetical protein